MSPVPGNAEFLIYVIVLIVLGLVAIFDDHVSADRFVWGATWVTVGYFISRGLAKATRVLEQLRLRCPGGPCRRGRLRDAGGARQADIRHNSRSHRRAGLRLRPCRRSSRPV